MNKYLVIISILVLLVSGCDKISTVGEAGSFGTPLEVTRFLDCNTNTVDIDIFQFGLNNDETILIAERIPAGMEVVDGSWSTSTPPDIAGDVLIWMFTNSMSMYGEIETEYLPSRITYRVSGIPSEGSEFRGRWALETAFEDELIMGKTSCISSGYIPISTCQGVQDMNNDLYGNYVLVNDIDCSMTSGWNHYNGNCNADFNTQQAWDAQNGCAWDLRTWDPVQGCDVSEGFEPIGNTDSINTFQGEPFTGVFDGQGYKITNLYINRPARDFIGLFGHIGRINVNDENIIVKNVGLENANIDGDYFVGGLAGKNRGKIENAYVNGGTIKASGGLGGLVGTLNGIISQSYTSVDVSTKFNRGTCGGLVGSTSNSGLAEIINSYATGDVDCGSMYVEG